MRFSLWADDEIITYQMEVFDDEPVRLPGGYVARTFQAQVNAKGPVEGVFVAEEFADLP